MMNKREFADLDPEVKITLRKYGSCSPTRCDDPMDFVADLMLSTYPEKQEEAKARYCSVCSVRTACLEYSISNREEFGVWGGVNEDDRRRIIRRRRRQAA